MPSYAIRFLTLVNKLTVTEPNSYFCMVLPERPRSIAARRSEGYKQRLSTEASRRVSKSPFFTAGELRLRIVWFHRENPTQDVDNVLKHVADSLKKIVYNDDARLAICVAERVDIRRNYEIRDLGVHPAVWNDLTALLEKDDVPHFLFVEVAYFAREYVDLGHEGDLGS